MAANNLLEALNKRSSTAGVQKGAQDLVTATQTGRINSASAPVSSQAAKMAEDAQQKDNRAVAQNEVAQEVTQDSQIELQQQQDQTAQQQVNFQGEEFKRDNAARAEELASNLKQNFQRLESTQRVSQLEEIGRRARLESNQYITELNQAGERARLEDSAQFTKQLRQSVMSNNLSVLQDSLSAQLDREVTAADFRTQGEQMKMDDIVGQWNANNEAAAESAKYGALGSLASTGVRIGAAKLAEGKK